MQAVILAGGKGTRLGAIGGAVRWESEIGHGTAIRGSLPLD